VVERVDYVILLLNAAALLSHVERRFLREVLAAEVGLQRVALVVTHIDLMPEDERDSILELLRAFLGPFESQPAILDLSLREIARGTAGAGGDALTTLMDDLLEQQTPLRSAATRQALTSILDDLASSAEEIDALYSLEDEDVRRVQETIASQSEWLEARILRMQGRVEAFVETLLKEQILRRIEGFGEAVCARLPEEIESVEDISVVRRYLPGYIETIWTEFLRGQMLAVRGELVEEESRIHAMIETDLQELLSGARRAGVGEDRDFDRDVLAFHVFVVPRRGKHRATNVARGLSLNGLFMLFFAPQMGILSLAASQVLQRLYRKDIAEADRQALVESALAASKDLEREIKGRVAEQFAGAAGQIKEDVAWAYRQGLEHMTTVLDERERHREDLELRRGEIAAILHQRIPRLRPLVEGLDRDGAG
jgi:hypothetical protein